MENKAIQCSASVSWGLARPESGLRLESFALQPSDDLSIELHIIQSARPPQKLPDLPVMIPGVSADMLAKLSRVRRHEAVVVAFIALDDFVGHPEQRKRGAQHGAA